MPLNDDREHEESSACWCDPITSWQDDEAGEIYRNGPIIVHNSSDCREIVERLTNEGLSAEKQWGIFVGE